MKKIKIFLTLLIVLFLSGCSGVYNVKINENQSVEEEATFNLDKSAYTYDYSLWLLSKYGVSEDDYKVLEEDNSIKVTFKKTYFNIDDYFVNSILYKQFYNEIEYTTDNDTVNIDGDTKLLLNSDDLSSNNIVNNYDVSLLNINLTLANKVFSNNADEVNDNVYSWTIDKNTTNKRISVSFSKDNNEKNKLYILVIVSIGLLIVGTAVVIFFKFRGRQKIN